MILLQRIKSRLFRWQTVIIAVSTLLPFCLLCVLGLLWLFERGVLFEFIFLTAIIGLALTGIFHLLQRPAKNDHTEQRIEQHATTPDIEANPEWNSKEAEAFKILCRQIHHQTQTVIDWQQLPNAALDIVTQASMILKSGTSQPLSFSAPEALLLIENTAKRYRGHLRDHVPFTDQISIAQLQWLWRNRKHFSSAWQLADAGRRIARFMTNPGGAAIKELELLLSGGPNQYLSDQVACTLQTLLLEEIAASAIDLYSGRLRFNDEELRKMTLGTERFDQTRMAQPDAPLRILIIGQISTGKSTFINHLIDDDLAEIDVAPTTAELTTYRGKIAAFECYFVDTPGMTGERKNTEQLLKEIVQSDMIIWLARADRPARSVDATLADAITQWQSANPQRRLAPIIPVITHVDRICERWPYTEHRIPSNTMNNISEACSAAASAMGAESPVPVCNCDPTWNLHSVYQKIDGAAVEAAMTQKNRKRLEGESQTRSLRQNAKRGLKGTYSGTRKLVEKWLSKNSQQD